MPATLSSAQLAVAKQICGYLSPPLPLNSAIAFCGNIGQESAFDPTALNAGEGSYGLVQWLGPRLANLRAWCSSNNLDPASVEGQCKFIIEELPTADGAPKIVPWLYDTTGPNGQPVRSLATLTADIVQYYERAGNPQLENRISYANQVAVFLGAQPPPPPPAPAPSAQSREIAFLIQLLTLMQQYDITARSP